MVKTQSIVVMKTDEPPLELLQLPETSGLMKYYWNRYLPLPLSLSLLLIYIYMDISIDIYYYNRIIRLFGAVIGSFQENIFFQQRMLLLSYSCPARWDQQYDFISWRDYLKAENMSVNYNQFYVDGLTRIIQAAKSEHARLVQFIPLYSIPFNLSFYSLSFRYIYLLFVDISILLLYIYIYIL